MRYLIKRVRDSFKGIIKSNIIGPIKYVVKVTIPVKHIPKIGEDRLIDNLHFHTSNSCIHYNTTSGY